MAQVDFFDALRNEVEREIMACIGCNDCLLACPLPEAKQVTIAQLNHAVLDEHIVSADVIGFVQACTQCQQCVPVCPADLHRADIVLYNKLKVEDVAADQEMPLQVGPNIAGSGWTLDALATHVAAFPLFEGVDPAVLRRMLQSATLRHLEPREVLVREGEYHERLFVVLDGSVEQTTASTTSDRTRILLLGPGSFHGELAVMGNQEETYTITCVMPATVLEFPKATVFRMMNEAPSFKATMDDLYRRRAIWTHARTSPMLAALPQEAVEDLLSDAEFRVLRPGAVVFREGDQPGDLHLVRAGFLRVARTFGSSERVLQYYREGDVFGAVALLFNQLQSASVSANTRAEIVTIPGASVTALLERAPELRKTMISEATKAEEAILQNLGSAPRPAPKDRATSQMMSIEGLVDRGVMQGHEVLLIDTSICIDCDNCVDACGRRHGYSRLERTGLQLGNMLFPSACRHCEDPVCLLCSVNGIVREPDGEIRIVPDNCIGCGACAERCPYDNIQMHELTEPSEGFLSKLIRRNEPEPSAEEQLTQRIAVKCDLCAGYDYYACVHACPVGAAMRVDPVEVFGRGDVLIGLEMKKSNA